MEIYLLGTRMCMIMEVNESFSFEAKTQADQLNPRSGRGSWGRFRNHYRKPNPARNGCRWSEYLN